MKKKKKQIQDKQKDFMDFQNSAEQEIDILHKKLLLLDQEKNNLLNHRNTNGDEMII